LSVFVFSFLRNIQPFAKKTVLRRILYLIHLPTLFMLRLTALLFFGIFASLVLLGNKNGRASQAQRGNTGAPGDETQNGQPKTCIACHGQGPIQASLSVSVLDSSSNPVTQYLPGKTYTARVTITASGANLNGYGFQMIGLRDSNNSDLDGFSDVNPNNYKIATISGGRTYAEHDNISTSNTFNVKWTAPATGTGSVTLYAAGNGVNATGTTGGDGSGFGTAKLTEFSSSTNSPEVGFLRLAVYPNPLQTTSTLQLDHLEAGSYTLRAFDLSGKQVWNTRQELPSGSATLLLQTSEWEPGIYFLQLEGANKVANVKVLKP
jgi:hypothetical protein